MREPQKQDLAPFRLPTTPPVSPYQQGGRIRSDWVVAFGRNRWPPSVGIGGRFASDSATEYPDFKLPGDCQGTSGGAVWRIYLKVDGEKMEPKDVARDFLKAKGVVK